MQITDQLKEAPTDPEADGYTAFWSNFWSVTQQTIRDWLRNDHMPFPHDMPGMLGWAGEPGKRPNGVIDKAAQLLAAGHAPNRLRIQDPDWQEFISKRNEASQADPLVLMRDYYQFKLRRANETANNQLDIETFANLVIKYEKAIRDNKLAADKLGIEEGQLFTKGQLTKVLRALTFWSMRGIDADLAELCPKMTGLASVADVRAILEPALLSARFVRPFAKAARVESDSALSAWMVAEIKDSVDDYVQDGAKEFEAVT